MIQWRTDKPLGAIIVAKLSLSFTLNEHSYDVLHFVEYPYRHYSDSGGEEVPYEAIEMWARIE